MKSTRILGAALAASALVLPAAVLAETDVTGTWNASFESQVGTQTYTYDLKVEGGTLTGHSKSNFGESDLTGKVEGDSVTFVERLNYQGIDLTITYNGQVVSDDEIKFKRDVGGQGGEEFTATRQK